MSMGRWCPQHLGHYPAKKLLAKEVQNEWMEQCTDVPLSAPVAASCGSSWPWLPCCPRGCGLTCQLSLPGAHFAGCQDHGHAAEVAVADAHEQGEDAGPGRVAEGGRTAGVDAQDEEGDEDHAQAGTGQQVGTPPVHGQGGQNLWGAGMWVPSGPPRSVLLPGTSAQLHLRPRPLRCPQDPSNPPHGALKRWGGDSI